MLVAEAVVHKEEDARTVGRVMQAADDEKSFKKIFRVLRGDEIKVVEQRERRDRHGASAHLQLTGIRASSSAKLILLIIRNLPMILAYKNIH